MGGRLYANWRQSCAVRTCARSASLGWYSFCLTGVLLPFVGTKLKLRYHEMISSDIDTFGFLVEQIEMICHLIGRYAIFEDVYLHEGSNFADQLGEALTRLYASVLLFLSKAKSFFEQNTAGKPK